MSNGCSNSPPNSTPNLQGVDDETLVKKKKTRGPAKLKTPVNGKEKRKEIEFNGRGQPIGDGSSEFSTYIGCLARELVSITQSKWPDLPKDIEDDLWKCVQVIIKFTHHHKFINFLSNYIYVC